MVVVNIYLTMVENALALMKLVDDLMLSVLTLVNRVLLKLVTGSTSKSRCSHVMLVWSTYLVVVATTDNSN